MFPPGASALAEQGAATLEAAQAMATPGAAWVAAGAFGLALLFALLSGGGGGGVGARDPAVVPVDVAPVPLDGAGLFYLSVLVIVAALMWARPGYLTR